MYNALRIDTDPTTWELSKAVEQASTSDAPQVLPVSHPLVGDLVLSPRSAGSAVFLEISFDTHGTRPNGMLIPQPAMYLPSPIGVDVHLNPPNFYIPAVDLAVLKAQIIAAMTDGTFLTMKVSRGEVIISGAALPFAVLCPATPLTTGAVGPPRS